MSDRKTEDRAREAEERRPRPRARGRRRPSPSSPRPRPRPRGCRGHSRSSPSLSTPRLPIILQRSGLGPLIRPSQPQVWEVPPRLPRVLSHLIADAHSRCSVCRHRRGEREERDAEGGLRGDAGLRRGRVMNGRRQGHGQGPRRAPGRGELVPVAVGGGLCVPTRPAPGRTAEGGSGLAGPSPTTELGTTEGRKQDRAPRGPRSALPAAVPGGAVPS